MMSRKVRLRKERLVRKVEALAVQDGVSREEFEAGLKAVDDHFAALAKARNARRKHRKQAASAMNQRRYF